MSDSPFALSPGGTKRPASESEDSKIDTNTMNKKQTLEVSCSVSSSSSSSSSVSMTKEQADTILESLSVPKPKKKQSHYVRFKSIMLEDAKKRKDNKTIKDITNLAKSAWEDVKNKHVEVGERNPRGLGDANMNTGEVSKVDKNLHLKAKMLAQEQKEIKDYNDSIDQFKIDFLEAAIASLHHHTLEAPSDNFALFETHVTSIHSNATKAWEEKDLPSTYLSMYQKANTKLLNVRKQVTVNKLVKTLTKASKKTIFEHAVKHYDALMEVEKLSKIKDLAANLEAKQKQEELKAMSTAFRIKSDIICGLRKQMIYTNPSLKRKAKAISYKCPVASPAVFAAAFDLPLGTKVATIDSYDVGCKSLRYGALACMDVTVKLVGSELRASTKYGIGL